MMMDVIEMMVENQADLVVHMEVDDVTKELEKMDQEQDGGLETVRMKKGVVMVEAKQGKVEVKGSLFLTRTGLVRCCETSFGRKGLAGSTLVLLTLEN